MDGPPAATEDFSALSLEDRLTHKVWKARKSGYEDAKTKFESLEEGDSEFGSFSRGVAKYLTDSNIPAQLAGLHAAIAFVQNAGKYALVCESHYFWSLMFYPRSTVSTIAAELATAAASKCAGSAKASI